VEWLLLLVLLMGVGLGLAMAAVVLPGSEIQAGRDLSSEQAEAWRLLQAQTSTTDPDMAGA
jgi:hypothetical protein